MGRSVLRVSTKVKTLKIYTVRAALIFLALILAFGLVEPGASTALAESAHTKSFDTNYKLDPLKSTAQQKQTELTQQSGSMLSRSTIKDPKVHKYEETSKRTAFTSTYVNNDGTKTMEYSASQRNYKDGSVWKKLDNTIQPVKQEAPEATLWQTITNTQPKAVELDQFSGKAGTMVADIKPLSQGVTIHVADRTITMKPAGARDITPIKLDDTSVIYRDAWPNVDLEYELRGESVKEIIVIKNKKAQTRFNFSVSGGKIINHPTRKGELAIEGLSDEYSFSALTLNLQDRGIISETRVTQSPNANADGITVSIDSDWLQTQPSSSFPMRIDPSLAKDSTGYWMYKSDGYSCGSSNCYANIGTISDNGWKYWRSYVQFPFNELAGKKVLNATLHGFFKSGQNGDTGGRWIFMGRANCISYDCRGTQVGATGGQSTDFDIDFTSAIQSSVDRYEYTTVWSLWGEESNYKTYKPYWDVAAYITYDSPTPIATPVAPLNEQVITDSQPTLSVNSVQDGDGDAVKYYFRVSTSPDAETGAVINSGWIDTPQWAIPDGVLQDGTTYYWHTYTLGALQTNPNWVQQFKIDMRTGKDSTQSYDTVGPVGVDLATGNASLGVSTHDISTLGGPMGLSLTYNTPNRAKKGLKGEYWNLSSGYNFANGAPTGNPTTTVRDSKIDFNWGTGAPSNASGINADWFYARWTGQFVAPATGNYQFGGSHDDNMHVWVNNIDAYNASISSNPMQYGSSISLQAGQVVPIRVEYMEVTGGAAARLYVKGAVSEQVVPLDWLYTNVSNQSQAYGLTGRYYTNPVYPDIDAAQQDASRLMLARRDSKMSLNFGNGGPASGMQVDNFMARWTGYITVPKAGQYKLGADSDDGIRIKVSTGSWQTSLDSWQDQAGRFIGNAVSLPANTPIPIQVDWYERGGGAALNLLIQSDDAGVPLQDMPVTWLTPDANVLPDQWKLGINVNGSVNYERLRTSNSSVILEDSTGSTHEYTYINGGYKPPVNENGTLSKNSDNSYTLTDSDGRTYVFDANGQLASLTAPVDDRKPAALKYTYAGSPSRLTKIEDGTTSARYANVYYKGINETDNICDKNGTNNPSSFFGLVSSFADAPSGKLCAFKTSDGDVTNFYYDGDGNLARIVKPGGQVTDYAYDEFGRITATRDSLAADAIAAGVRSTDDTVTTQLSYDTLGRITAIKAPAPTASTGRSNHTFNYINTLKTVTPLTPIGSTPVAGTTTGVSWGGNRIDLFARGTGDDLIHRWTSDGTTWSAWESLGGCIREKPSAASWKAGRLDIFVKNCATSGNMLNHRAYDNNQWYGWDTSPSFNNVPMASAPSVVSWSDGRLDWVVRGTDNKLYQGCYSGGWGCGGVIAQAGCITGTPTITSGAAWELDIYATGCDAGTDKTIGKTTYRASPGWSTSVSQSFTGVNVQARANRTDIGITAYTKSSGIAYAQIGDQTLKISDCSIDAPAVITTQATAYAFFTPCGSTDTQQYKLSKSGATEMHIAGASEPNGFSKHIQYDSLLRTTAETDLTGKTALTEWDAVKDLQLSTTDATGLKSTTIYDKLDRATDSYGPAPAAWYSSSREPLSSYTSQVPHTKTGIDEGLNGLAISVFDNTKLTGTPKLYATGMTQTAEPYYDINLTNSIVTPTDGLSMRATGRVKLDQTGAYTFRLFHGGGARLYIDSVLVVNDWSTGDERFSPEGTYTNDFAGKYVSVTIETFKSGTTGTGVNGRAVAVLHQKAPGQSAPTGTNLTYQLTPEYNLTTSQTVYDSQLGNIATTTTYSKPEYGLVDKTTLDPTGLNLQSTATYETPGAGYLRQTSNTLAGGASTTYQHYTGADTRDNPCTTEVESYHQAGRPKSGTDPTGRTSETIYNESGDVIATRYNSEPWTCLNYDSRGQIVNTVVPSIGNMNGRSITNNYAVGGNPLIASISDSTGTVITETDLLGHVIKYTDARGNITTNTYDVFGKLTQRTSPVGTETYEYDAYDRLSKQKLDGVTFASITYDEFSRIDTVDYQGGMNLRPTVRDSLGRTKKITYNVNGLDITDEVMRSTSGLVMSGSENGVSKTYSYDKADRLTGATVGGNTFTYGYGASDSSCSGVPNNNIDAGKDGNRTSYTLNGQTITYCYNTGDQLITSSDQRFSQVAYDAHGNTTGMGDATHRTEFSYDANDRNIGIKETTESASRETTYGRDVNNRIYHRVYSVNGTALDNSYYGFTGTSDDPSFLTDTNGTVVQKYLNLVGGIKVTIKPQSTSAGATTYSISNIQGNTMATVNADGTPTIIAPNGPFGEKLANHNAPANAATGVSNDYMGLHRKATESGYLIQPIQMGARVYIPELGRFLQIDTVDGGAANAYAYVLDPVNQKDVNGQWIIAVIMVVIAVVSIVVAAQSIHTAVKKPTPTNITIAVIDTAGAAGAVVSGGATVAASKAAGAGVRAAASASAKAAQLAANKAAGKEAERIALEQAKARYAKDYELRTQQYFKVAGYERGRFADITAYKNGQPVFNIEVKSGNARYSGTVQEAKDQAILDQYGVPTYIKYVSLTGK